MSVHGALTTYSCECESYGVRPVRIPKRRREMLAYRVQSANGRYGADGWLVAVRAFETACDGRPAKSTAGCLCLHTVRGAAWISYIRWEVSFSHTALERRRPLTAPET